MLFSKLFTSFKTFSDTWKKFIFDALKKHIWSICLARICLFCDNLKEASSCSNIDSKSLNNIYLNIIEISFLLHIFIYSHNMNNYSIITQKRPKFNFQYLTSNHQFLALPTIQLRYSRFVLCLDDKSWHGTPLCQNLACR